MPLYMTRAYVKEALLCRWLHANDVLLTCHVSVGGGVVKSYTFISVRTRVVRLRKNFTS